MGEVFRYSSAVSADWIDYNGHMQDAYYNLVFSLAVDAFQDEMDLGAAYRERTGCTIYLLESHVYYLAEVKEGDPLDVETRVIGCDTKRFHLHMTMLSGGGLRAVGEFMELNVRQRPAPKAAAMPDDIVARIAAARMDDDEVAALRHRARPIGM